MCTLYALNSLSIDMLSFLKITILGQLIGVCFALQMLFHHAVTLQRAHSAMQKLNEFTKTEQSNEPLGEIISSDSIFAGVFTLLSNLLASPNATCLSFCNMDSIVRVDACGCHVNYKDCLSLFRNSKNVFCIVFLFLFRSFLNKNASTWNGNWSARTQNWQTTRKSRNMSKRF